MWPVYILYNMNILLYCAELSNIFIGVYKSATNCVFAAPESYSQY